VKAHKEYLEHIRKCPLYDGWQQVFEFLKVNNIQAAIVSGNNRQVLNVAVKAAGLKDVFPKDKINRIGCNDVNGRRVKKSEGDSALFEYALKQLEITPENALAFGNQYCDAQAAANAGIKAYHCLWGADVKEKEQMLADSEHQCITSPLQIIDILRSEHTSQS
jgi:phosphoglycolate phosphatase